jgi:hypothetical protein
MHILAERLGGDERNFLKGSRGLSDGTNLATKLANLFTVFASIDYGLDNDDFDLSRRSEYFQLNYTRTGIPYGTMLDGNRLGA